MIKFLLNHIPRPVLQKAAGWVAPVAGLFYAGRGVQCPVCGARYRKFMPYGYVETRPNALCPRCLALERHRLLWLWLEREKMGSVSTPGHRAMPCAIDNGLTPLSSPTLKILHIAPEVCLMHKFEKLIPPENYITADLESPLAKVHFDVQDIPFPDGTFDVIFCNHILEHVGNDRLAMREMHRVMRSGGWGVMLSPVDEGRETTFEDDTVTDPTERTRIFGQYDHRRIYGRDYADRLREAGWQVDEVDYYSATTPQERSLYALRPEILYIVHKP